jgi:predicted histone-like DNA-binding protein
MTVKFNVVERRNPIDPSAPKKHYPSIQPTGRKNLRQLSKRIGEVSMVRRSDVLAILDAMLYVIPEELAEGYVVELGDFGSFWLRISGEGQESAEDVRPNHITNTLPRFTPGPEFKEVLDKIKYAKANSASPAPAEYIPGPGTIPAPPPEPPSAGGPVQP